MFFCCFYGFICDFLEFLSVKSSKHFAAHRTQRDTNFKQEKSRVYKGSFFQIYVFYPCLTGLIDFRGKRAPTKVKYLLTVCQIFRNFTEGKSRMFTFSFAVCAHVDVTKYYTFPFERAQIT